MPASARVLPHAATVVQQACSTNSWTLDRRRSRRVTRRARCPRQPRTGVGTRRRRAAAWPEPARCRRPWRRRHCRRRVQQLRISDHIGHRPALAAAPATALPRGARQPHGRRSRRRLRLGSSQLVCASARRRVALDRDGSGLSVADALPPTEAPSGPSTTTMTTTALLDAPGGPTRGRAGALLIADVCNYRACVVACRALTALPCSRVVLDQAHVSAPAAAAPLDGRGSRDAGGCALGASVVTGGGAAGRARGGDDAAGRAGGAGDRRLRVTAHAALAALTAFARRMGAFVAARRVDARSGGASCFPAALDRGAARAGVQLRTAVRRCAQCARCTAGAPAAGRGAGADPYRASSAANQRAPRRGGDDARETLPNTRRYFLFNSELHSRSGSDSASQARERAGSLDVTRAGPTGSVCGTVRASARGL